MQVYELDYRGTQTLHNTMPNLLEYLFNTADYRNMELIETAFYVGASMGEDKKITLHRGDNTVATIKTREVRT